MELLIRIKDKEQPDKELAQRASKAGDVIAACPDGWAWTEAEKTNPEWRIIQVPLLEVEKDALLASPQADSLQKSFRTKRIDLTKMDIPYSPEKILKVAKTTLTTAVKIVT
jgi:hypothetical protein